jgi:two-component system KDP operon response regulator KdpE
MSADVLLVEDDAAARDVLAANLQAHGYTVRSAEDGADGLRLWEARRPDIVLLDLGLPDMDGESLIRRIRRDAMTPILVLSARDQERDKVKALDLGADDYVTKPAGMAELQARLRAALRRGSSPADSGGRLTVGPVAIDLGQRAVRVHGALVHLTPREYELLKILLGYAGRVVTRGRLLRAVWGEAYSNEAHYLHVHVAAIRRKLAEADPSGTAARLIVAEPGVGYRIRDPADEAS